MCSALVIEMDVELISLVSQNKNYMTRAATATDKWDKESSFVSQLLTKWETRVSIENYHLVFTVAVASLRLVMIALLVSQLLPISICMLYCGGEWKRWAKPERHRHQQI